MNGYWVVRTYEAGAVGEKTKFWVPGERPSKSGRREKQEIKKQEQNEQSAEKSMARLLNANFCQGDLLLGLDYSEEGLERILSWAREQGMNVDGSEEERMDAVRAAAEHELRLVLRRVKREMAKAGLVLRYVAVTSDMDGDTGETVRVHHHMVVPAEAREAFVEKWAGMGGVDWSPLSAQEDYTPIAAYLIRQVRRVPDAKKYVSSRNLVRPQPRDRVALTDAELRVPRGAKLLHRNEYKPGRPQYIRYVLPEEKQHRPPPGGKTA